MDISTIKVNIEAENLNETKEELSQLTGLLEQAHALIDSISMKKMRLQLKD